MGRARRRYAVAPARNVVPRPAGRTWEECAAYPLATLTAYRMLRRARLRPARRCSSSASAPACRAPPWPSPATSAPTSSRPAAARPSGPRRWRWGPWRRSTPPTSAGPCRPTSSSRASARRRGTSRCASLKPGGRLVVCGGTSGAQGGAQPAPAVLQAVRDHRLVDGQLPGVRRGDRADAARASPSTSTRSWRWPTTRRRWPASRPASNSARSSCGTDQDLVLASIRAQHASGCQNVLVSGHPPAGRAPGLRIARRDSVRPGGVHHRRG